MKNHILFFALVMIAKMVNSQTLTTDTLFATAGQVSALPVGMTTISNMLRYPDGKLLLGGYNYDFNCNCDRNTMMRVDACGVIDSSFGLNGTVHHTFEYTNSGHSYVLQPDGKIVVAGLQSIGNGSSQMLPSISRYNYDGSVDTTFGTMGTNKITTVTGFSLFYSLFLLPDGKFFCSGQQGYGNHLIMRFDTIGQVDNTFGTQGMIIHPTPPNMSLLNGFVSAIRSDGKIVSARSGFFDQLLVLDCYDTLGVEDSTFGVNGYVIDQNFLVGGYTPKIVLQSDDKVIVAKQNSAESSITIARYNTDGSIDTSYGVDGYIHIATPSLPGRLLMLSKFSDDSILIGYEETGAPSIFKKFDVDGILDENFSLNGGTSFLFGNGDRVKIAMIADNGEMVFGGSGAAMSFGRFFLGSPEPHITQDFLTLSSGVTIPGTTFQWFYNGTAIDGATENEYTVSEDGEYMVEVSNIIGCVFSDVFVVNNTGIELVNVQDGISIYPNPTTGDVFLTNPHQSIQTIRVFGINGKLIFETRNTSSNQLVPMSDFSEGVYVVEVTTSNGILRKRVVRN